LLVRLFGSALEHAPLKTPTVRPAAAREKIEKLALRIESLLA
jgi:hypothetical protein